MFGRAVLAPIERLSSTAFVAGAVVGVVLPLAATVAAAGALDWVLGGAGVSWAVAGAVAAVHRRRVASLPLELGAAVLTGRVNGSTVYRFRARLGHGRTGLGTHCDVTFVPEDGEGVGLEVVETPARVVGPWTVVAVDRRGVCQPGGQLSVRVHTNEGGRQWSAEGSYRVADARKGWFRAPVRTGSGRLRWDDTGWDRVAGETV